MRITVEARSAVAVAGRDGSVSSASSPSSVPGPTMISLAPSGCAGSSLNEPSCTT